MPQCPRVSLRSTRAAGLQSFSGRGTAELTQSSMWRIGIDIGGTKIEALALSPAGEEYGRRRITTPRGDYEATLRAAARLTSDLVAAIGQENLAGVGVGIPGSLSPKTGLVRNANSTWLNRRAFRQDLQSMIE